MRFFSQAWCLCVLALAGVVTAGESPLPEKAVVPLQVIGRSCNGQTCQQSVMSRGSAVCLDRVSSKVVLLTAKHCLPERNGEQLQVFLNSAWVNAECFRTSKAGADLAMIAADTANCEQLVCVATRRPAIGESVTVAGWVLGRELGIRTGRVRLAEALADTVAIPSSRAGQEVFAGSVIPGESGGAVFDVAGDLAGITIEHHPDSPWVGRYVHQAEIMRFVTAAGYRGPPVAVDPVIPAEPDSAPTPAPFVRPSRPLTPLPEVPVEPVLPVDPVSPVEPIEPVTPAKPLPPEDAPKLVTPSTPAAEVEPSTASASVSPQRKSADVRRSWWDFGLSGVGLGVAIAGAVATGGAGTIGVILPAVNSWQKGRAAIAALAALRHPANQPSDPTGCFVASPAPPRSPLVPTANPLKPEREVSAIQLRSPFPRDLDAASQLLELGQLEGRIPLCDALRGMFLDDELEKLVASGEPKTLELVSQLKKAIQIRVDQAAPLSVKV